MKWLQVLLFNINYSSQYYSFDCTQSNGSKYYNVSLTIQLNISHLFTPVVSNPQFQNLSMNHLVPSQIIFSLVLPDLWLELGRQTDRENTVTFDMFHIVAVIIKETEVKPSFWQMGHDHLLQLSKEFKHYFPIKKDSKMANKWIRKQFGNKLGQSTLSLLKRNNWLILQMTVNLKSLCILG